MESIEFHSQKGGVGCTTLATATALRAHELGRKVAAMSIDPTKGLVRELEGTGIPIVEPDEEPDAEIDVLIVDRNTQCREPALAETRVMPIRDRLSWEIACDLSDRYSGTLLWVPSMMMFEKQLEIPEYLEGLVQITAAVPLSHAIAFSAWRRRVVWTEPGLAGSAGARALWCAANDILRRAMGPRVELAEASRALPLEPGASVLLRHAPRPGLRIGALRPELGFEGDGDAGAELQLLELSRGAARPLGAPWRYEVESPPVPRDIVGSPYQIAVGDALLVKVTNTGSQAITSARMIVDDDQSVAVPLYLPRTIPAVVPTAAAC